MDLLPEAELVTPTPIEDPLTRGELLSLEAAAGKLTSDAAGEQEALSRETILF